MVFTSDLVMEFSGKVIKGKGRGKVLGFPTINLETETKLDSGIFICKTKIFDKDYFGLLHVGPRPVFGEEDFSVEIYLLNFENGKIPEELNIEFVKFLRKVKNFENIQELIMQMEKDKKEAMKFIRGG